LRARKTKNCEKAATVADIRICTVLISPARAVPPKVLKKVIPLVMIASMSAFPQSNFCSIAEVLLFIQQTRNPLTVNVGFMFFKQFMSLPLMVKVSFTKSYFASSMFG